MSTRPESLLWWRAAMVWTMTFLIGAVGHVSAGGQLPSWFVLAATLAIGTTISALVLARPASTARIVGLVVLGQTACHALLSLSAGHAGDVGASRPTIGAGGLPVSGGGRVGTLQDHYEAMLTSHAAGSALTVPDPSALLEHLPMFVAHTVVAGVVGLWLAAGERAVVTLLALAVAALVAALVAVLVAVLVQATPMPIGTRRVAPMRRRAGTLPSLARVARCVVRRGPPALIAG